MQSQCCNVAASNRSFRSERYTGRSNGDHGGPRERGDSEPDPKGNRAVKQLDPECTEACVDLIESK